MVQLSHPNLTTGKIIALTTGNFVGKVMSLLFNTLSRLVITFLPRSKCLLISCMQSPSTVILEPKKMKSITASILSPSRRVAWCQILSPFMEDGEMWTAEWAPESLWRKSSGSFPPEVGLFQKGVDTWCQSQRVPVGPARLSSLWPLGTWALSTLLGQVVIDVYDSSWANREHLWKESTFLDYWKVEGFLFL